MIKLLLSVFIFLNGYACFAYTLSSVEIESNGNSGKIVFDTDKKSISKKLISNNEIELKFKNTLTEENVKTLYNKVPSNTEISIMQNGKDTFVNIAAQNISKYELIYAKNHEIIPIKNIKKDIFVLSAIFLLVSIISICSRRMNLLLSENKKTEIKHENYNNTIKINYHFNKNNINKTIRDKSEKYSNYSIHGNPVKNFGENRIYTVSNPFDNIENKYFDYSAIKQIVNS